MSYEQRMALSNFLFGMAAGVFLCWLIFLVNGAA